DALQRLDEVGQSGAMMRVDHADADHIQGAAHARDLMKTKIAAHPLTVEPLESGDEILTYATIKAQDFSIPMPPCKVDILLKEGDTIEVGDLKLKVWHTPGHTAGQLSFKMGKLLFSGDNIYKDSCVGVIDAHHGSNLPDFIKSLQRIVKDDAEFLLPSHGPVFRRDKKILQKAIDRLTQYQYMADFGTCAVSWPLLDEWEKEVTAGKMPDFSKK
ncbi:MAG TPA: MBL fold metallo-hydrolase, partial [Gemmataceae bacterium]|nr:MBL fold metallo-hydrolase [Gemmataceae bacterium]